ncbi:MAG: MerR family DNA-binding transcriptional regulator, partial [Bacteroidetes bacterium]|nr:MerR family DNA-binding transcriptional regulator [Bacteroidota bacterium]
MPSETLTTGEVAAQANVNVQTVRYYERRGLIP